MKNRITKIFFTKQFIKFLCIGGLNLFNGIFFAYIFSTLFSVYSAFLLGYICSLLIAYILNSRWIFKQKLDINKCLKFIISYIPNFIIQNICVIILYNYFNLDKLLVYTISAFISVPVTFIMVKFFVMDNI